jgi:tRNA (guanine-N7-)-methyltransferase
MSRPLSLIIQDHVIPWRELDWPLPWERIFHRTAPLTLDIGFGSGEFLEEQATLHPERDFIGIELSWTSATCLFRRLERTGLSNVRILLVDATVALGHFFAPESLHEVFINHPCPWPKARHAARRLVQPEFLGLLAERMALDAPLTLVTDHADYAIWATEALEGQDALVSRHPTTEIAEIPGRQPTRYQLKATGQGIPIHFFEWRKARSPEQRRPLSHSDPLDTMPSLTLTSSDGSREHRSAPLDGFQPFTHRAQHDGVETTVRLVAAYENFDGATWLIQAMVVEDELHQEFAIQLIEQPSGDLLLKLSTLARPHPTWGVKMAIWQIGRWLTERHPHLAVKHENLGREVVG